MGMHNLISRTQPRLVDQRCEERRTDVIERAAIHWRGQEYLVPVVDISSRGTRIRSDIAPCIGETVLIQFENCTRMHAFVRWIRDGQIGLNFGHELILG